MTNSDTYKQSNDLLSVSRDAVFFTSGDRRMRVSLDRITHISAEQTQTMIYTLGRRYPTTYAISDMFNLLPPASFFRVHPLHIVAISHVRGMDCKEVIVGDHRLFTTSYFRSQLVEALGRRRICNSGRRTDRDILF